MLALYLLKIQSNVMWTATLFVFYTGNCTDLIADSYTSENTTKHKSINS